MKDVPRNCPSRMYFKSKACNWNKLSKTLSLNKPIREFIYYNHLYKISPNSLLINDSTTQDNIITIRSSRRKTDWKVSIACLVSFEWWFFKHLSMCFLKKEVPCFVDSQANCLAQYIHFPLMVMPLLSLILSKWSHTLDSPSLSFLLLAGSVGGGVVF